MALSWVRLDANIGNHDKILALLADPSSKKWQAYASYVTALAWSGGQGTDGKIPQTALPFVHGTPNTARLLVKYQLWDEVLTGWQIRNFDTRQELAIVREAKRSAQSAGARKANCNRFHGAKCECWKEAS